MDTIRNLANYYVKEFPDSMIAIMQKSNNDIDDFYISSLSERDYLVVPSSDGWVCVVMARPFNESLILYTCQTLELKIKPGIIIHNPDIHKH